MWGPNGSSKSKIIDGPCLGLKWEKCLVVEKPKKCIHIQFSDENTERPSLITRADKFPHFIKIKDNEYHLILNIK